LGIDVETLWQLREALDPDSLRVCEIDAALRDFTLIVDFEVPRPEFLQTVVAGRERLKPALQANNGTTVPTHFGFGHAHIDVAWLWPLAETERKVARTVANQLVLAEEYPDFVFLLSQPHLYVMLQDRYPALYKRLRTAIEAGQVIPEGGMWVQADTNVTGGEGLIRQFIHGKRFFREQFGVDCRFLWLPDVFGYSGALPQIMKGCGIDYFSTHKIFWLYNGGDPFPYNTFVWEGIDGSEVLTHLCNDYNSVTGPTATIERWRQRVQKDGIATRLFPFGWGDGGGGPTRNHIEFAQRQADLQGAPKFVMASPIDFFSDQLERGLPDARYVGELYFQCHRGTYTSQARTKKGNRKSELALREAELWGVAASALGEFQYPEYQMDRAWKSVLLNHFHDILPGSSIHRVYEEAEAAYDRVQETAAGVMESAAAALTKPTEGLTVFNSLSWERHALVPLPVGAPGACDEDGNALPAQVTQGETCVEVTVPACGWTTVTYGAANAPVTGVEASEKALENEFLRVEINDAGEIQHLIDKETGYDLLADAANALQMYRDVPTAFDAWDIDSMYTLTPVELEREAAISVSASGPLKAALAVQRPFHDSELRQEISLRKGSRRVDFRTWIDWHERHKLLKVDFPLTIHADHALHEIQFGHIQRPNHRSRPFDADQFEVPAQKWTALVEEGRGAAVLNDCKYGVSVLDDTISLTLLKAALAPDMTADLGTHELVYSLLTWNGSFHQSPVVREAYELNCPVRTHTGAAGTRSLFALDADNVVVETVKPAEEINQDGARDVVVRLYEAKRTSTDCVLSTSLPVEKVWITDMLETPKREAEFTADGIPLRFRPFEIKTLRLRLDQ
jgi:alpha-mannosidase